MAFFDGSTGGNAKFITNGTGYVDFSGSIGPGFDGRITAGSIAGSGTYYIGAGNTLITGGNNLSTEVSGVIADFNPSPPCGCPAFRGRARSRRSAPARWFCRAPTAIPAPPRSMAASSRWTVRSHRQPDHRQCQRRAGRHRHGRQYHDRRRRCVHAGQWHAGLFHDGGRQSRLPVRRAVPGGLSPSTSSLAKVTGTASLDGGTGAAFLTGNYVAAIYHPDRDRRRQRHLHVIRHTEHPPRFQGQPEL